IELNCSIMQKTRRQSGLMSETFTDIRLANMKEDGRLAYACNSPSVSFSLIVVAHEY
ncbi:unnamed protein product, partial [Oikopleura dioica]